ncbi:DUF3558 domain-containing protein [Rhodococcus sp. NPDC058514]|uniref:DUF3558 domain-containing protein n=1 Tax=Rhodococcus sp. NPDC058514 TaxID=3346532 RepID=UPI0036578639
MVTLALPMLTACGADEEVTSVAEPTTQATTRTAEPEPTVAPSPPLAGVDPCALLTDNEVAAATAVDGIVGRFHPVTSANVIGCEWGDGGPGSAGVTFLVADSEFGADTTRAYGEVGGRPITLDRGRHDSCVLTVRFSDDRRISVSLAPTTEHLLAQPAPLGELVCQRTLELTKSAVTRLGWT